MGHFKFYGPNSTGLEVSLGMIDFVNYCQHFKKTILSFFLIEIYEHYSQIHVFEMEIL